MPAQWKAFEKIDGLKFKPVDFCETLDGGQAFTWNKSENYSDEEPEYAGVFSNCAAKIRLDKSGCVLFSIPEKSKSKPSDIAEYLDAFRDYKKIRSDLKSTGDAIMSKSLDIYPSLRILRQSPSEAIVSFICSSSKRIVQIKQCVTLLSKNFGEELAGGYYQIPTFEKLASAPLEKIFECKLGFRAKYLQASAKKIVKDKFDPMSLREIPYLEAKKYLTGLSGIGDKVADCILLFGASRFEAFPVDTWIKQAMTELYSTPSDAKKIRDFAAEKFGRHAGFAQQLIFAAKRKNQI